MNAIIRRGPRRLLPQKTSGVSRGPTNGLSLPRVQDDFPTDSEPVPKEIE